MAAAKLSHVVPPAPAEEDPSQRIELRVISLIVDVEADAPRRLWFIVVVPTRHDHGPVVEDDAVCLAVFDEPGQRELADAVSGATPLLSANGTTRTDRVTVARFEVAAGDMPQLGRRRCGGHAGILTGG